MLMLKVIALQLVAVAGLVSFFALQMMFGKVKADTNECFEVFSLLSVIAWPVMLEMRKQNDTEHEWVEGKTDGWMGTESWR